MTFINCPECAAEVDSGASRCPRCGKPIKPGAVTESAPIHRAGGKLQALGIIMIAASIIATMTGAWWGAALAFPAMVIFILGRFMQ